MRTRLGQLWSRLIEAFVAQRIRADPDASRRARLIIALVGVLGLGIFVREITFLVTGEILQALVLLVVVAAIGAVPFVLRATQSLVFAGNILVGVLFLAVTRAAIARGGLGSPSLISASALGLVATFLAGRRSGIAWTLVVMVQVVVFAALRRSGYLLFDRWRAHSFYIDLSGALLFPLALLGIALAYEWAKDAALEAKARAERERALAEREASMLRTDRMASVGQLAAGIAHEANNPLGYVSANLAFAQERLSELDADNLAVLRAEIDEALAEARQGAERIARVVRDLKTFARPEPNSGATLVSLHAVLDSTLKMANTELVHRAHVTRDYDAVPPVRADEARLAQVFLNLLLNAAQALPDGRADCHEVTVATRSEGTDSVVVEVSDTGCGIRPEDLPHVTEPFFTTKPVGVGTGLGLSVCQSIVHGLGGTLSIDSAPGTGTRVRVTLPAARDVGDARKNPSLRAGPLSRELRILIVDDDPLVRRSMQRTLREHAVTLAASGRDAIERVRRGERFDLILCDVMMPELTGIDVHDHIAAIDENVARRIVFLTGGAFVEATATRLEQLPNERCFKPIDLSKINELLRTAQSRSDDCG